MRLAEDASRALVCVAKETILIEAHPHPDPAKDVAVFSPVTDDAQSEAPLELARRLADETRRLWHLLRANPETACKEPTKRQSSAPPFGRHHRSGAITLSHSALNRPQLTRFICASKFACTTPNRLRVHT